VKKLTKNRIKTTVFWSGIASSLIIFAQSIMTLLGMDLPAETVATVLAAVNSLLAVLTFSGVLVNPEHVESFQAMKIKATK
jgi:uncharacterized membrane protein